MMQKSNLPLVLGASLIVLLASAGGIKSEGLDGAIQAYEEALANRSEISLPLYVKGAREMQAVIGKFGKLFSFADKEFGKMVTKLEQAGVSPEGERNPAFNSIQSAIEFEIIENSTRSKRSATRLVADLHWAIKWMSSFMKKLSKLDDHDATSAAANEAYSEVFGKKHPYAIRTLINLALRTLPHKGSLVERIMGDNKVDDEKNVKLTKFASCIDELIEQLESFYSDKGLGRMIN